MASKRPEWDGARKRRQRVGQEVKRIREEKDLTVAEVAKRLGVSHTYISNVESGLSSLARVADMARALGVPVKRLETAAGVCPTCKGAGVV